MGIRAHELFRGSGMQSEGATLEENSQQIPSPENSSGSTAENAASVLGSLGSQNSGSVGET